MRFEGGNQSMKDASKVVCPPNKPKVPTKPLHLAYINHKSASFPSPARNEVTIKADSKGQPKKTCKIPDSRKKPFIDLRRRCLSDAILTNCAPLDSSSPPHSHPASINASKNISEDNDYVTIDFPSVQPGTIIRTNRASGAIQMLQNNSNHHASTNAKKTTARSASDSALSPTKVSSELLCDQHNAVVKELQKTFNGTHRRQLHSLPSPSTADECGYEIPIAFQTPTYMTLDEIQTFPEQNVFGSPKINEELKLCRNKKVRLARYKRNVLDRSSASLEEEEYSHDLKQNQDEESHEDDIIENSKKINEAVPTPINSFLSARLKSCSFNCPKKHNHANTRLRNSLGSSGMTYSASGSDDDFSDDELESESHYQQIDFPHTNLCENAYERIYEILHSDHDRKPSRRKHPYEYVELETKDPVFTPLPCEHDLQQHHVKNFSEMRCNYAADCTWNTVATPGVLKLSNYKKTIENFYTVP